MKEPLSLYLHIPFCERKCEYCDFVSLPGNDGQAEYVAALKTEIQRLCAALPERPKFQTIFIGGGTPSFIHPGYIAELLDLVGSLADVENGAEITMEANPSSVSVERAETWRAGGVNRISLGIQSLEPDILKFLGRVHDAERALAAVREVKEAGFKDVNCDLIYAVPGLDDERWTKTLQSVIDLQPQHVSAYELTYEPGTPLHHNVRAGKIKPADAEVALRQHRIALETLSSSGLMQYEVSNYALPGGECRHNLNYWRRGYYLAAGLGAHGHLPVEWADALGCKAENDAVSVRYWHGRSLPKYMHAVESDDSATIEWESVNAHAARTEELMLGLRLNQGISLRPEEIELSAPFVTQLLLELEGDRAVVTSRGQEVLDELIRSIVTTDHRVAIRSDS